MHQHEADTPARPHLEHIENFLREYCKTHSRQTVKTYRSYLRQWAAWAMAEGHAWPPTKQQWQQWWRHRTGMIHGGKQWHVEASAHRTFWRWSCGQDSSLTNPVHIDFLPKMHRKRRTPLSTAQLAALMQRDCPETARAQQNALATRLLMATGCRIAELTAITLAKLNLKTRTAFVKTKGGAEGALHFDEATAEEIRKWLKHRHKLATPESPGTLLLSLHGRKPVPNEFARQIAGYARARGVELTPHLLRHTFATRLIEGGAGIKEVQTLMNHTSVKSTLHYVHTSEKATKAAQRKLNLPSPGRGFPAKAVPAAPLGGGKPSVATKEDTTLVTENPAASTHGGGDILSLEDALWL